VEHQELGLHILHPCRENSVGKGWLQSWTDRKRICTGDRKDREDSVGTGGAAIAGPMEMQPGFNTCAAGLGTGQMIQGEKLPSVHALNSGVPPGRRPHGVPEPGDKSPGYCHPSLRDAFRPVPY